jgi:hypothetical protein
VSEPTTRVETRVTYFPPTGGIKHLMAKDLDDARHVCEMKDDCAPMIEQRTITVTDWVIVENSVSS